MKQVHAALRLLICLLLVVAWGKQASPASPDNSTEAAIVTDERVDLTVGQPASAARVLHGCVINGDRENTHALEGPQA